MITVKFWHSGIYLQVSLSSHSQFEIQPSQQSTYNCEG